jgi:hypothetical protein
MKFLNMKTMRMNKTIRALMLMALIGLGAMPAMAQSTFEGVITMTTTNTAIKETAEVTWYLKGESSRMDIRSMADGMASDYALIADAKGTDMVSKGHVTPIAQKELRTANATMTLLDESKGHKVNGYDCIKRTYTDGTDDITYWLTSALPIGFKDLPMLLRRNMPRLEDNLFPVKMEKRDASGTVLLTQDLRTLTPTAVPATRFERN